MRTTFLDPDPVRPYDSTRHNITTTYHLHVRLPFSSPSDPTAIRQMSRTVAVIFLPLVTVAICFSVGFGLDNSPDIGMDILKGFSLSLGLRLLAQCLSCLCGGKPKNKEERWILACLSIPVEILPGAVLPIIGGAIKNGLLCGSGITLFASGIFDRVVFSDSSNETKEETQRILPNP